MPRPLALLSILLTAAMAGSSAAQQPPAPVAPQAQVAQPPVEFQLPPARQAWLDQVLTKWEEDSKTVTNFYCDFERDVHSMLGPADGRPFAKEQGKLGYNKPDKGSFQITEAMVWTLERQPPQQGDIEASSATPQGNYQAAKEPGEHWVCNGTNVYEYRQHDKKLVVTPIPPQMQGKEIVNGPLPFLFGAEAAKLKKRYWLRPDDKLCSQKYIGIHAKPKFQADAANYSDVWVVLRNEPGQPLLPAGLRILMPDKSWHEYRFNLKTAQVNPRVAGWFAQLFQEPRTPWGWQRIEEPMRQAQQPQPPQR